jgi:hypothetical protein
MIASGNLRPLQWSSPFNGPMRQMSPRSLENNGILKQMDPSSPRRTCFHVPHGNMVAQCNLGSLESNFGPLLWSLGCAMGLGKDGCLGQMARVPHKNMVP